MPETYSGTVPIAQRRWRPALKYRFVRTPLERPLLRLREVLAVASRLRHPELGEVYREGARIREILRRVLRPDWNCLDVGAHYGSMLSAILRHAPRGRHTAVEPMPEKAAFLRGKFPEVRLHEVALADGPGRALFYVNERQSGFSGLARHGGEDDPFRTIEVRRETLDRIMAGAPRVHFAKIDVEGAEESVLRGGRAFVREHRPLLLFDCGPSGPAVFGRTPGDLFEVVDGELGYEVLFLHDFLAGGPAVSRATFEAALVYPFRALTWMARPR